MNKGRIAKRVAAGMALLLVAGIAASIAASKVERTPAGVHTRLMVPLLGLAYAKVPMHAGTGDKPNIAGFLDGPVIKRNPDRSWSATWFCENQVYHHTGYGSSVHIACAGKNSNYSIAPAAPAQPGITSMPEKLLVLSDIEGNIAYLNGALRKLGVVDANGAWAFGANRVVVAGDAVDRGRDVFAVLWRLYGLSQQASAAGGRLDLVIGNHEQYILRGNISRANPEHVYALEQMGGVDASFGGDTVIGAWLRTQPVILKIGDVLIAHGGISPSVARQGFTVDRLNAANGSYWRKGKPDAPALDAVFGMHGVSQYRGYLMELPDVYPMATQDDVDLALRAFGVKTIVVGHTIVEKVSGLYADRVYAIDVNSNTAAPEALMFVNGVPNVVDTGTPRALPDENARGGLRRIDLLSADDWTTLSRMARRSYQLSQLPHPY